MLNNYRMQTLSYEDIQLYETCTRLRDLSYRLIDLIPFAPKATEATEKTKTTEATEETEKAKTTEATEETEETEATKATEATVLPNTLLIYFYDPNSQRVMPDGQIKAIRESYPQPNLPIPEQLQDLNGYDEFRRLIVDNRNMLNFTLRTENYELTCTKEQTCYCSTLTIPKYIINMQDEKFNILTQRIGKFVPLEGGGAV